ncbi:iron-containing alcohol dehydrogenase family protein [Yinghuangia seranimata]|uniref:iron-containing alcohol dehydrogenase family protein n=1 Tax=Yinghuangia seranimata TaxID=408067 RepID=UPI00248C039D|nr:iron-containing alcohol dehydrogenase family protein [Yinghuangia seranimata]MDI2131718.1 iron-containing alcohol dehydrogenase family protein [Yinghuangia seranimata]
MPVLTRLVPAPLTVDIRAGALDDLTTLLADARISTSGRLAMVVSEGSGSRMRERFAPQLPDADWYSVTGGSLSAAVDLADRMRAGSYDAVVGVGGGRVLDATKYAAARVGLPVVAVATNLAHDGIASPVASLDNDAGRGSYGVPTPIALVVDLDLIREAPQRFVRSGIGEALSNLCSVADWELSARETGEEVDGLAAAFARTAAEALLYRPDTADDDAFLVALAEGLVLSGLAMSVAGTSRPCSGACHEISHAIDLKFPERDGLHGEQVGLGGAFATYLRGDRDLTDRLIACLDRHKLPVLPEQLGLSADEFVDVLEYAPSTRPGRYTILEHLNLGRDALRDAAADYVNTYSG